MIPYRFVLILALAGAVSGCAATPVRQVSAAPALTPVLAANPAPAPQAEAFGPSIVGLASWYRPGPGLHRTCTGQPFKGDALSAASPLLPMGTKVRVSRLSDDRSVVVLVDDCMPRGHRAIDLSETAARQLGLVSSGVAMVSITPIIVAENP
jgi:rare lipoprotein A